MTYPFSPLLMTEGSVRISPTPTETHAHKGFIIMTSAIKQQQYNSAECTGSQIRMAIHLNLFVKMAIWLQRVFTLQVEHQQLSARVLVGPVAEGQHGFLQEVGGVDLFSVVVVELPELPSNALFYSEPLSGRVTVEQKHLQKPEHRGLEFQGYRKGRYDEKIPQNSSPFF